MKKWNIIPSENYKSSLSVRETQHAIKDVKDCFEKNLAEKLNLFRVSAPLFVTPKSGLNDNLNGVERPVSFDIPALDDNVAEIVQSLAKWKRVALKNYGFDPGEGIYTDMNAIRRDEELDNLHSVYVDQWDWELVIREEDRNEIFLKNIVKKIFEVFKISEQYICSKYDIIDLFVPNEIFFVSSQELEDAFPLISPKERENKIAKEKKAVFITQIGKFLRSGERHDGRAPDYDDWELNGDLLFWYPILNRAMELSSMGIRVNSQSLARQLEMSGCEDRKKYEFHKKLLENKLPQTIGGGIGQSRICMLFLEKAHIGEVQSSVWPKEMTDLLRKNGIELL